MARLIRTEKEVEGRWTEQWIVVEEDVIEQWPAGPLEVVHGFEHGGLIASGRQSPEFGGFSVPEGTKAGHGQPPDQGGGGGIRRGFVPEDREIGVGRPYRRSTLISSSTDGAPSGRPSPSR